MAVALPARSDARRRAAGDERSQPDPLLALVARAQAGDEGARERVIALCAKPAARIASRAVGRYVRLGMDDEFSVALMAVDEAIDRFDPARGRRFLAFAERVIRRRLIDHGRLKAPPETPLSALTVEDDEGNSYVPALGRRALELATAADESAARHEEILCYALRLREFGLGLEELVEVSPRHADARRDAVAIGRLVAADPALRAYLYEHRALPLKALEARVRATRKTIERHRKYIIAVALVSPSEFPHLYEYLKVHEQADALAGRRSG
jgi:RNA polymerase sigma factor